MKKKSKKILATLITATILVSTSVVAFAAENNTETVSSTVRTTSASWQDEWEKIKSDYTQISLTPGRNESELNFDWYTKSIQSTGSAAYYVPRIKIATNKEMSNAKYLTVKSEQIDSIDGYQSNKATATGLEENTAYYYCYEINGYKQYSKIFTYTTKDKDKFSLLYVGDPQIGASGVPGLDSYNWNKTLETALTAKPNASFIISAGDQIQSDTYIKNEPQYAGYLYSKVLKSLPVATTIGNHDYNTKNYSYHFNNPNASELGATEAGGDYYYSYGNTLFIVLNTNNNDVTQHAKLIEKAIEENKNSKWRVVTLHHDIYGVGYHSVSDTVLNLRKSLVPILEDNDIDVVLTGHDHTYARSAIIERGGEDTSTVNPKGILYMTAGSSSGSKYYDLVEKQPSYIKMSWGDNVRTYSYISINDTTFTIKTYRADTKVKIDEFAITKTN